MDLAATLETLPELADDRFKALVGGEAWERLPKPVQRRFSKRLSEGTIVYVGEVIEAKANLAGRILTHAARLIGGPLPLVLEPGPSVVTVTEGGGGGQVWTRLYARRLGFPQVVHSTKTFAGPTGLEEHVGGGVGMALNVTVEDGVLVFRSAWYFVALGPWKLRLPRIAEPGRITVSHAELGDGRFSFTLDVRHRLFGPLIRQHAVFREDLP